MIKINLRQTKVSTMNTGIMEDGSQARGSVSEFKTKSTFSQMSENLQKIDWANFDAKLLIRIISNFILIASGFFGLKIYEIRTIGNLKAQLKETQERLKIETQKITQINKEIEGLGKYQSEANEFENKKIIFKKLAVRRLQVPKLLDQIQSAKPKYVWLKDIKMSVEKGDISISGEGTKEDEVNLFVNNLGQTVIDRNTAQFNTSDLKSESRGNKIKFDVKGSLLSEGQK